jgi:hypothetical protein
LGSTATLGKMSTRIAGASVCWRAAPCLAALALCKLSAVAR